MVMITLVAPSGEQLLQVQVDGMDTTQALRSHLEHELEGCHASFVKVDGSILRDDDPLDSLCEGELLTTIIQRNPTIFLTPSSCDRFLMLDTATKNVKPIEHGLGVEPFGWGKSKLVGGKVYCMPYAHNKSFLVLDLNTEIVSHIDVSSFAQIPFGFNWADMDVIDGKLYCLPSNSNQILVYDTENNEMNGLDISHCETCASKWQDLVVTSGKLYGMPDESDVLLVHDICTQKSCGIDTSSVASGQYKWSGMNVIGEYIYCLPMDADKMLVVNSNSDEIFGIDVSALAICEAKWSSGAVANHILYGAPDGSDTMLMYNALTGSLSGIDISHLANGLSKWDRSLVYEQVFYAAPARAQCILMYDIISGVVSGIDISHCCSPNNDDLRWSEIAAVESCVYCLPNSESKLLVYETSTEQVSVIQTPVETSANSDGGGVNKKFEGCIILQKECADSINSAKKRKLISTDVGLSGVAEPGHHESAEVINEET